MDERVRQLSDQLVAKWTSPEGVRLMAAGTAVVGGLLEHGPLTEPQAAVLLGWPDDEVLARFRAMNFGLEMDPGGVAVVGAGVSLNPALPHSMELRGGRRHGWCAMDVLMFPVAFQEEASRVTSRCAATGQPISLTVTPRGVDDVDPSTAAVTLAPATGGDIRDVFCDRVNFYATPELARQAVDVDPELAVCSVAEAWGIGKRLADLF
ncbi:organomercurial lyase [Streptomyces rectiviolaceus]|uniref:Organomercurial lyase MerB n=1 Tax=Streptomyces rectiviolaceus TaxID=332591 RepID=A0ABP6NF72_9ACTN